LKFYFTKNTNFSFYKKKIKMAKKALDFGKLVLPQKSSIVKKEEAGQPIIEQAIEKIHREVVKPAPVVTAATQAATVAPSAQKVVTKNTPVAKPTRKTAIVEISDDEATPVKKISMDLPLDVYKYLKINAFDRATTMKDYVLRLIEADMAKRK
jgi:hypothetical protein